MDYIFKDLVSDFKWKRANEKAQKEIDKTIKKTKEWQNDPLKNTFM